MNIGLLNKSNQAIARVTGNSLASAKERAEALALKGRNAKTVWRLQFESLPDIAKRRAAALNPALLKAYEPYYDAYLADLNHSYSAIAALQMGVIMQDLSQEAEWTDLFDNDTEATEYKAKLDDRLTTLRAAARLAIKAELKRLPSDDEGRVFVEISEADLLFLTCDRPNRIANAYLDAVPKNDRFAWDTARGQLELYAGLDIRTESALLAIDKVEATLPPAPPKDMHIVLFVGHRIDEPKRPEPRFPAALEEKVRDGIRAALAKAKSAATRLVVLSSGAPGSDIICHELCRELQIEHTLCLPMRRDDFAGQCFANIDDSWRTRFLHLADVRTLELSDSSDGIPRWLRATGKNAWERGNQWVLEMALSSGARTIKAIALWDRKETSDGPGGTAHMVQLVRLSGNIEIDIVDLPS